MRLQKIERMNARDNTLPGWQEGRKLQVGNAALTDYEGKLKPVIVTGRENYASCESGVLLQVQPVLRGNHDDEWFDSGWFAPVTPNVQAVGAASAAPARVQS